jgi:hypothetical protein
MTNAVKISLSIKLQGSTLVRQEETEVRILTNKKTGKTFKKKFKTINLIPKPATLVKQMPQEAYDYFISMESCPQFKKKEWRKMSVTEKIEYHMAALCKYHNGISYTYHIFED